MPLPEPYRPGMTMSEYAPDRALEDGDQAAHELADALGKAGFTLPSLRGGLPVDSKGFVELGGAGAEMVTQLADWIKARA